MFRGCRNVGIDRQARCGTFLQPRGRSERFSVVPLRDDAEIATERFLFVHQQALFDVHLASIRARVVIHPSNAVFVASPSPLLQILEGGRRRVLRIVILLAMFELVAEDLLDAIVRLVMISLAF